MTPLAIITLAICHLFSMIAPTYFGDKTLTRRYSREKTIGIWALTYIAMFVMVIIVMYTAQLIKGNPDFRIGDNPLSIFITLIFEIAISVTTFLKLYTEPKMSTVFAVSFYYLISIFVTVSACDFIVTGILLSFPIKGSSEIYTLVLVELSLVLFVCTPIISKTVRSVKLFIQLMGDYVFNYIAITILILFISIVNISLWNGIDGSFIITIANSLTFMIMFSMVYVIIIRNISDTSNKLRISSELETARKIQKTILPCSDDFKDLSGIEVSASMNATKEVGGDFYDLFLVDKSHICFVIADVSDSGIPAALFMMRSKTEIRNLAFSTKSPSDTITKSNKLLMESNDSDMFVTAFMGILDLTDGSFKYCNAGHNPPIIRRKTGTELLKERNGPFIGIKNHIYTENEMKLEKGDMIVLYTDGVTEANDENGSFFGLEKVIDIVSSADNPKNATNTINEKVNEFTKNELTDDTTILSFRYDHPIQTSEYLAKEDELPKITEWASDVLSKYEDSLKSKIELIIEEVFLNIAQNSYPNEDGRVFFYIDMEEEIKLTFCDYGIPFNPLSKDIGEQGPLNGRELGGNGIRLIRNMSDDVTYTYVRGMNVLTITMIPQSMREEKK